MITRSTVVLLGWMIFTPGWADAATYYVSPTGTATPLSNCTTSGTPCSVATGLAGAVAGDTVRFLAGTYSPGNAPNAETPAYNPTNSGTAGNFITFICDTTLACTISDAANAASTGWAAVGSNGKSYIIWDGFIFDRDKIPAGSLASTLFKVEAASFITIRNNEFVGRDNTGNSLNGTMMSFTNNSTDITVTNNKFHGMTCSPNCVSVCDMWVFSADRVDIYNNEFTSQNQAICWKTNPNHVNVFRNWFSNSSNMDILDHSETASASNYNVHHNVSISCVPFYRSDDGNASNSTGRNIYNNTMYCAGAMSSYNFQIGTSGSQGQINTSIYNNIISVGGSSYCGLYYDSPASATFPILLDYNDYYGTCHWWYNKNLGSANDYASLASWQGNTHSPDSHSISTNPLFVTAGGITPVSYKLQAGSPALTASSTGGQIGAYEGDPCIGYGCTSTGSSRATGTMVFTGSVRIF